MRWEARFGGLHFPLLLPAMTSLFAHFPHAQKVQQVGGLSLGLVNPLLTLEPLACSCAGELEEKAEVPGCTSWTSELAVWRSTHEKHD